MKELRNERPPPTRGRKSDRRCTPRTKAGGRADRVRSQQLRPECVDRCAPAAADHQSDHIVAERSPDVDQPSEEPGEPAAFVAAAARALNSAYSTVARTGPAHRLRRPADRPRVLDYLCAGVVKPIGSSTRRRRADALAERGRWPSGCNAGASDCGW